MEHTQIATTHRDPLMRAVEKEMAKFERQETVFRKKNGQERAAELRVDIDNQRTSENRIFWLVVPYCNKLLFVGMNNLLNFLRHIENAGFV